MKKIFIPTSSPMDWKQFLADPEKHWRKGFSAMSLAESWEHAQPDMPDEVSKCLDASSDSRLARLQLLLAIPEYKVCLPGGKRPSQTDLFALCRNENGLVCVAVEGKVNEEFGPAVAQKLADPSDGQRERMRFLLHRLGLPENISGEIRYQLLHRAVSALLLAETFHAHTAVMLIHSFSAENRWLEDFQTFAALFGKKAEVGKAIHLRDCGSVALFTGWAKGREEY